MAGALAILPDEMLVHMTRFLTPCSAFMLKCTASAFAPIVRERVFNPARHAEPVERPALWMAYKEGNLRLLTCLDIPYSDAELDMEVNSHNWCTPYTLRSSLFDAVASLAREDVFEYLFARFPLASLVGVNACNAIDEAVMKSNYTLFRRLLVGDWRVVREDDHEIHVGALCHAFYGATWTSVPCIQALLCYMENDADIHHFLAAHRYELFNEIVTNNATGMWDTDEDGAMEILLQWCWDRTEDALPTRDDFIHAALTRHCALPFLAVFGVSSLQEYLFCAHGCHEDDDDPPCGRACAILPDMSAARFATVVAACGGRRPCRWVLRQWANDPSLSKHTHLLL